MAHILQALTRGPINATIPSMERSYLKWNILAIFGWATALNHAYTDACRPSMEVVEVVKRHALTVSLASASITKAWNEGVGGNNAE
jgi:hypothetical protein